MRIAYSLLVALALIVPAQAQSTITVVPILDKAVCTIRASFTRSCVHSVSEKSATARCTGTISAGGDRGHYVLTARAKKAPGTPPHRTNNNEFISCSPISSSIEWYGCSIREKVGDAAAVYSAHCGTCERRNGERICIDLRGTLKITAIPETRRAEN